MKNKSFIILTVYLTLCLHGITFASEDEIKQIWDRLLQNYTKQFRPNIDDQATVIQLSAFLLSIPEIDTLREELTCNLYFRQIWTDPRLQHTKRDVLRLDGANEQWTKLWQPDTFMVNEINSQRHDLTHPNMMVMIFPNGTIRWSSRYTIVSSCPMHFSNFPFDEQICEVQFESYAYGADDLLYEWIGSGFKLNPGISHASFRIVGHKTESSTVTLSSGRYCRAQYQILFQRAHGRFLLEFFYPCLFLASLSILSLFIKEPRTSVILNFITMCVTIMFLSMSTGNLDVPRVSYTTALDQFSSMTNTFVFLSLIASLLTLRLSTTTNRRQNFELSNLRPNVSSGGHSRLENDVGDEEVNLCNSNAPDPTVYSSQSKFQALIKTFTDIFALILPFLKIVLVIAYLFANLIYWTTIPYKKPKYDDALLTQDWQLL